MTIKQNSAIKLYGLVSNNHIYLTKQNYLPLIPNQTKTSKLSISFGYTIDRLPPFGQKRVTRRCWKESHANKFLKAYKEDRWVRAINKGYYAGGQQIGWLSLRTPPYLESLSAISQTDCAAEGYPEICIPVQARLDVE